MPRTPPSRATQAPARTTNRCSTNRVWEGVAFGMRMLARRDGISLRRGLVLASLLLSRPPRLSAFSSGLPKSCSAITRPARGRATPDISSAGSVAVACCALCFLYDVGSVPLGFVARSLIVSFWVWGAAAGWFGILDSEWTHLSGTLPKPSMQQTESPSGRTRLLRVNDAPLQPIFHTSLSSKR